MEFQRKVFYINEYTGSLCGKKEGYLKVVQRGERIQVEFYVNGSGNLSGKKLYLLERDKHATRKSFFGIVPAADEEMFVQRNIPHINEIVGVIIQGEEGKIWGGRNDTESLLLDDVSEEKEMEEKIQVAETTEEEENEIIEIEMEVAHDEAYEYQKLFSAREKMYPFEDDEFQTCIQISPRDFSDFSKEYWHLGSNTFLLRGFYNYRHLILAEVKDALYIGIPGQYHRREQYLADMFGFARFKGIRKKECRLGDFGYWLMQIQKPQPTEQWVDCGKTSVSYPEME